VGERLSLWLISNQPIAHRDNHSLGHGPDCQQNIAKPFSHLVYLQQFMAEFAAPCRSTIYSVVRDNTANPSFHLDYMCAGITRKA
jgi:hypothetical protein